tara:strand:- start:192 stop:401 length:210 start_codon:yes stop_codon:yes gene_type:complete
MEYIATQTQRINEDKIMVEITMKGQVVASGIYHHAVKQCIDWIHNPKMISLNMRHEIELDIEHERTIVY